MDTISELPKENKVEGPIDFVDVIIPKDLLSSSVGTTPPKQRLLGFLKESENPRISFFFTNDEQEVSSRYAFRGFVRDLTPYPNEQEKNRYNPEEAEKRIHELGHEKLIPDESTEQLITSPNVDVAIGFATPRRENEIGYLVVYDNEDGAFNSSTRMEDVNMSDINSGTKIRDRIKTVIVLRPENTRRGIIRRTLGR